MRSPFSSGMLLRFDVPFQGEAKRLEFAESQAKGQVDLLPTRGTEEIPTALRRTIAPESLRWVPATTPWPQAKVANRLTRRIPPLLYSQRQHNLQGLSIRTPHKQTSLASCGSLLRGAGTPDTYGWCFMVARTLAGRRSIASCTPTADATRTDWRRGFRNARPSGLCDQIPSLPPRRRSYGASPADLLQGLHRLRGGAGAAGRCEQPRTLTGEVPAESVGLIAGELLKRCIELRSPSPAAAHSQVLLEECAVVAVLLRRILWRRAPRRNQTLRRAAGHTAIVVAYPGLKSRACATHWGSGRGFGTLANPATFLSRYRNASARRAGSSWCGWVALRSGGRPMNRDGNGRSMWGPRRERRVARWR